MTCNSMGQYIYNSRSSSMPFFYFVFVCILYFAKPHSVCCKRRFEATFTSMSFLCVCRFSRGWALSLALCRARMGSFCALVNLSQFLRCGESSLALKRFFSIRPLPSSLWLDPLVRIEGDSFSLLVLSWITESFGSAWNKASSWVEWEPGLWLNTSNNWEILKSKLHQQTGLMAIWKD